jgi:NitT/TauT family transport system ATP-binding protein
MTNISVNGLVKYYGPKKIIDNLSAGFPPGRITAVLGPSGCGKTTLLKIIAGLTPSDAGTVIREPGPVSMVFQDPLLFPWRTVYQNVEAVAGEIKDKGERKELILNLLQILGIKNYRDAYPDTLSGGMKQRAALARAFAFPASIILLDEPFRGLDIPLKMSLIRDFDSLWKRDARTALFVTHDVIESVMLGDEICIMSPRPMKTEKTFKNELEHTERNPHHPYILSLQKEIYQYILS